MNIINLLKSIQPQQDKIDEIKSILWPIFDRHKMRLIDIGGYNKPKRENPLPGYYHTRVKSKKFLYRGRPCDDAFHKGIQMQTKDLSYNPAAPFNRANRLGSPLFYASNGEIGAYQEIGVKDGDKIIVSYWEIIDYLKILNVGFTHIFYDTSITLAPQGVLPEQAAYLDSYEGKRLDFFLTELFTASVEHECPKDYVYSISVAVAEILFELGIKNNVKVDGILYPSVKFITESEHVDNFALKTDAVERCLKFYKAEEIVVDKVVNKSLVNIRRLDSAHRIDEQGNLVWNEMPDQLYMNMPNGNKKVFDVGKDFLIFRGIE